MRLGRTQQKGVTRLPADLSGRPAAIYSNSVIDPYTIRAYSLEQHKQCYNIVIGKEKYIYILQQVRRNILHLCVFLLFLLQLSGIRADIVVSG